MGSRKDIYQQLNEGLRLWHNQDPFPAHECWEWVWHHTTGEEKELSQAMVQLAAARTKHLRGERVGTVKNLSKARDRIANLTSLAIFSLDIPALQQRVDRVGSSPADDTILKEVLPLRCHETGFVYLHGFGSGPPSAKAQQFRRTMEADGHVFRIPDLNYPRFEDLTLSRAIQHGRRCLFDRTLIVGSSMGGYVASLIANQDPRVQAMVLMAPAFGIGPRFLELCGAQYAQQWQTEGQLLVDHHIYEKKVPIRYSFIEDARQHPSRPELHIPTYILAGQRDDIIPVELIEAAVQPIGPQVRFDVVDDDHSLLNHVEKAITAAKSLANEHVMSLVS